MGIFYSQAVPPDVLQGEELTGVTAPTTTSETILYTFEKVWLPTTTIRWMLEATCVNNANAKNIRVRLGGIGGTIYYQRNMASTTGITVQGTISNRNSVSSQVGSVIAGTTHTGTVLAWGKTTSSVDTGGSGTTLVVTIEKATDTDSVILERFLVEMF